MEILGFVERQNDYMGSIKRFEGIKSNPVQIAEYAIRNKIDSEPGLSWWVYEVLCTKDQILGKVKSKYWKQTHKFSVRVPKTVKEALEIDEESEFDLWKKAIEREMTNIKSAFCILNDTEMVLIGYQFIKCHI